MFGFGKSRKNVSTDSGKIDELLTRSVNMIYPDRKSLRELLLSGKQIKAYVGIDPTADYVHLGHSTNYLVLQRLHELGHKIIVLVGDFTAMIGDPSDKTSARSRLSREQVIQNLRTFKEQIGKILDFGNKENPIEFRFNSEWLAKLDFEKMAELASNFTVQQMLERDMFERRLEDKKPLYVHEFFYPLLQGYDSVELGIDLEVGGTDQTFNMLAGRTLVRRYLDREKFVLVTTLLEDPKTGEKLMSKSRGTGIGLNEPPDDMFGKTMALPDSVIIQLFTDCTRISIPEIEAKRKRLKAGENPKDVKLELAHEIVKIYHGELAARAAREKFEELFSKRQAPQNLPVLHVSAGTTPLLLVMKSKAARSKAEARRLVEQGALEIDGEVWRKPDAALELRDGQVIRIGKHRFFRVRI